VAVAGGELAAGETLPLLPLSMSLSLSLSMSLSMSMSQRCKN
jgi:hypothetical protein